MNTTCNKLGKICRHDGIRHPQVDFMENVPRDTPAATIAPGIHIIRARLACLGLSANR